MKIVVLIFIMFIFLFFFSHKCVKYIENYMDNSHLNILNLVLYSDSDDYKDMYKLTKKHYKKYKNVDTIYYIFSEKYDTPYYYDKNKDILYIRGTESYLPGILDKTVKSFKYIKNIEEINDKKYNYIVRSNISTIVDFKKLTKELSKSPIDYGGGLKNIIKKGHIDKPGGIIDDRYNGLEYVSGTCIIISENLLKKMIPIIDNINYSVIDDVSIGEFISRFFPQYIIKSFEKYFVINGLVDNKLCNPSKYIFFRNRHNNRKDDIKMMEYIIQKL